MKVGILTFHSQLNYGGVLQCWALQQVLLGLLNGKVDENGQECEVFVVDRWLDKRNATLCREFLELGWRGWLKLIIRGLLGCGEFGKLLRTVRTIRFVRGLKLTKDHFWQWEEVEKLNLQTIRQLDLLVVGSDQVWNCSCWGRPRTYLLEGAPRIKAIAYAASFGMKSLPREMTDLCKQGLARFTDISCREREGVDICRELGFSATHVADPTILLDPSEWRKAVQSSSQKIPKSKNRKLVCYFMSVDLNAALLQLEKFASEMNCMVEVLTNDAALVPMPNSIGAVLRNFRRSRVKVCRGCGPMDFVRAFVDASWVLTDSFHAVMFSSIFNCNARFIRPTNEMRKLMFSRVTEFAATCIDGLFLVDDIGQALHSFEHGEKITYNSARISALRAKSLRWLEAAVKVGNCELGRKT